MGEGSVLSIYIAPVKKEPVIKVSEIKVFPEKGVEGDHHFISKGSEVKKYEPENEITLIEIEAINALATDYKIEVDPGEMRRNIITRNVPLNHLVNSEFKIGEVNIKGLELCEPCSHLEKLTGKKLIKGLFHRGGLRARILNSGIIRDGDKIKF